MGLFDIFKKKEGTKIPKGFHEVSIKQKVSLAEGSVKLVFDIPAGLKSTFEYIPGQYVNLAANINGKEVRRSYSICSGTEEDLAVGIKKVEKGIFSTYALEQLNVGDSILISAPLGNFTWNSDLKNIIAFAAGSGITPILSIAKKADKSEQAMTLFFGNKSTKTEMFKEELAQLSTVQIERFYSKEQVVGANIGRLSKDAVIEIVKSNLEILKSDAFFICGPFEMVEDIKSALKLFGVPDSKIFFELFEAKVEEVDSKSPAKGTHSGDVKVKVILDQEETTFKMNTNGNILQKAIDNGVDAPYSCRGGVCSSCKCKLVEGTVDMKINFTLTDSEVQQGYILSCQSYPTSETITVSFDD